MKCHLACCIFLTVAFATNAATFTNSTSTDAFVWATAPASNYGGAGALAVSGPDAVNGSGGANGRFDSLLRFNTGAMIANFDSRFGVNQWVVVSARLRVTELGAPANTIFNRGVGAFEIRWLANDAWQEGTGNPNTPAATGIVYNDLPTLLSGATDVSLGSFNNAGLDGSRSFALALPPAFVDDLRAGGEVGFYLTATDPGVGFTFDSRSFGTVSARPFLEITAVPVPALITCTVSGSEVTLEAANGESGATYAVLASEDVASPLEEWLVIATEEATADGAFNIVIPDAAPTAVTQQFFRLQVSEQLNGLRMQSGSRK